MPDEDVELCASCDQDLDLHCDDCGECDCDGSCTEEVEED